MRHPALPTTLLGRQEFERHHVPIPAGMEAATVRVIPAASGKLHIPNRCRYARDHAGQPVSLLEVRWADLCRNCAGTEAIDPVYADTLHAVAALSEMRRAIGTFAEELADAGRSFEWIDHARRRANPPITSESVPNLTAAMRGVRGWAETLAAINRAALEYCRQYDTLLARLADRLGSDVEDGLLDRAIDIVATETPARAESELLQKITCAPDPEPHSYLRRRRGLFDAWGYVADLWLQSHRSGDTETATIVERAKQHLAHHLAQVRDLTQLPVDPSVVAHPADTPQSWADRVLATLRDRNVTAWADRAEMTLHSLRDAHRTAAGTEPERALLVPGWPLISNESERLAYLTQYPTLLAPVRIDGGHDWGSPSHQTCVAVLRVPDAAAEQAHAISAQTASIPLTTGIDPLSAASQLLRSYGIVVHPIDVPATARPSQLIATERARLAAAITDTPFQAHPRPFTHGASLPPHVYHPNTEWTPLTARAAFDRRGSVFIPGVDDLDRFALGFDVSGMYDSVDVQVRLETPAGTPPLVQRHWSQTPDIEHPPTPTTAGLIDVPAALHGLTGDRTSLLLAISPCHEPIPVPLNYIAMLQALR